MKNVTKISFITKDTNPVDFVESFFEKHKREYIDYIADRIEKLKPKEIGAFETVKIKMQSDNEEIANMQAFYRGAVLPYYYYQSRDWWGKIKSEHLMIADDELKREIGFILYDEKGNPLKENGVTQTNSTLTLKNTKLFSEFLKNIQENCFGEQYIYPDPEHFKSIAKQKGRDVASRQTKAELIQQYKNLNLDVENDVV